MRTFHLPLPEPLHEALRAEARKALRPATEIAREALEDGLAARRRARLADEIRAYAEALAGTDQDLGEPGAARPHGRRHSRRRRRVAWGWGRRRSPGHDARPRQADAAAGDAAAGGDGERGGGH